MTVCLFLHLLLIESYPGKNNDLVSRGLPLPDHVVDISPRFGTQVLVEAPFSDLFPKLRKSRRKSEHQSLIKWSRTLRAMHTSLKDSFVLYS